MTMTELLTNASAAEATDEAAALAALLNADQLARAALGRPTTYTAADVLRLGRIASEYVAPAEPAPAPAVSFTLPKAGAVGLQAVAKEVGQ